MARECYFCGKTYQSARTYKKIKSKYDPTNSRKQKANLQWVVLPHSKKRVKVCPRCRKNIIKTQVKS
ncbi:MAG: hypothetical protein KBI15_00885 [Candidatus Pacebacteria bacterium]|nr:hypothetical protein [Candidatus Paceibacterota bacterium]MDD3434532.1 L28 family ribosomal protein [Candidatus Paceibacterota bacterium]